MIESASDPTDNNPVFDEFPYEVRTPRAIRFSKPERQRFKSAATDRGVSCGEFVREAALSRATAISAHESTTISPGIDALNRQTHRYVYVLSTIRRNDLLRDGRGREVDDIVDLARKAQAQAPSRD